MRDVNNYKALVKDDYIAFAGPDWPTYEDFCSHQNVPDFVYDEIDSFSANQQAFDNSAFCVLPFYGIEYPQSTSCCLMLPHDLDQVRQQMLDGVRPAACSKCWHLEDLGITSDRQLKNSMLDYYTNRDISNLYQQSKDGQSTIISYKIDSSNVCNATCVTCNAQSSSAWHDLTRKNNNAIDIDDQSISSQTAEEIIDFDTAVAINFRGGEPLLSKTNFYILEQLIKHNNTNCFVSFTTNGSITPNSRQLGILKQFKNIGFNFSIDGIGKVFEYMRYPLTWNKLLENINFCKQNNIDASVSYTVSNLNILYYQETIQWFKDNGLSYITNPVYIPAHFCPTSLPNDVKLKIIEIANDIEVTKLLANHTLSDDRQFLIFKTEIQKQDLWKKISMIDYLPKLVAILNQA